MNAKGRDVGIRRYLEMPVVCTSRVWLCSICGAKVYYGRVAAQPKYQCLCGGREWRPNSVN